MADIVVPTQAQLRQLEELRQQEWEMTRQAALESSWVMANVLYPDTAEKHYWEPSHRPLCDWLDKTPPGGKRAAIFHRQGRKTSLLNVVRAVRLICKYPNIRITLVSALQRTAIDMCALIKRQFTSNRSFAHYFPEFHIDDLKWGKMDEFTVPWRTSTGLLDPTLFATYLGSAVISRRCDELCYDDPVDDDDVSNPDMAAKTMANFTKFIPVVDDTSDLRRTTFIGTFKSYNDPASAICGNSSATLQEDDKKAASGWEVVYRPISFVPNGDFYQPGEFAFPDENPKATIHLPNIHTAERIRGIYQECLADKDKGESYFYREYACLVRAPSDQKFHAEWLDTWVDPQMVPPNLAFTGIAVDSALKDEQVLFKGDHMVILIGHYDAQGNLYLSDGARSRAWQMEDFRRVLLSMVQNPKNRAPQNFIKEKVGEGVLFPEIRRWFTEAKRPIVLHPLKVIGQGKKYLRITGSLQSPLASRRIFFIKGQFPEDLHKVLVDELVHLGQWGHDDLADCLALFFHPDIRVLPAFDQKPVAWKDVVSRPLQISTAWNNQAAASHEAKMLSPKSAPNTRLTPFGAESILSWTEIVDQPAARPWAVDDGQSIEQSKVDRFMPKLEKMNG